jgi:hypothetical protein
MQSIAPRVVLFIASSASSAWWRSSLTGSCCWVFVACWSSLPSPEVPLVVALLGAHRSCMRTCACGGLTLSRRRMRTPLPCFHPSRRPRAAASVGTWASTSSVGPTGGRLRRPYPTGFSSYCWTPTAPPSPVCSSSSSVTPSRSNAFRQLAPLGPVGRIAGAADRSCPPRPLGAGGALDHAGSPGSDRAGCCCRCYCCCCCACGWT